MRFPQFTETEDTPATQRRIRRVDLRQRHREQIRRQACLRYGVDLKKIISDWLGVERRCVELYVVFGLLVDQGDICP